MPEEETIKEEPTTEAPVTPEEIQETSAEGERASGVEAAPVMADPDAKPDDLPEPAAEMVTPEALPDDEDLSKIEGKEVVKTELNRHLRPGMVVRVHEIIMDVTPSGEERRRVQVFEGTVLGLKGGGIGRTMTVRKVSKGFGVEKIYPLASPNIEKVEVLKQLRVRRAKLNFLRGIFKRNRVKKRFRRALKEV